MVCFLFFLSPTTFSTFYSLYDSFWLHYFDHNLIYFSLFNFLTYPRYLSLFISPMITYSIYLCIYLIVSSLTTTVAFLSLNNILFIFLFIFLFIIVLSHLFYLSLFLSWFHTFFFLCITPTEFNSIQYSKHFDK